MKHVEVTVRVILDAEEREATAEVVAQALVDHLDNELPTLWMEDDKVAYEIRYAALVGTKVAKGTQTR